MALVRNFAMSPEEIASVSPLPPGPGWMSCHLGDGGLRDLPRQLPRGALLILDDSQVPENPDQTQILKQLQSLISALSPDALLLDFQRPGIRVLAELAEFLQKNLSCPVGISEAYGKAAGGPVFLSLIPCHRTVKQAVKPWEGRELWLEMGPAPETACITGTGTVFTPFTGALPPCPHCSPALHCHYGITVSRQEAVFTLVRSPGDLKELTLEAEHLGVTRTVGLYQELFP